MTALYNYISRLSNILSKFVDLCCDFYVNNRFFGQNRAFFANVPSLRQTALIAHR